MSKKLPYEEAFERQMNNLPSPDQEASWQKMKQLLDDKGKDRRRTRRMLWTLLVVLLLISGWYLINTRSTSSHKPLVITTKNSSAKDDIKTSQAGKTIEQPTAQESNKGGSTSPLMLNNHATTTGSETTSSTSNTSALPKRYSNNKKDKAGTGEPSLVNKSYNDWRAKVKNSTLPAGDTDDTKLAAVGDIIKPSTETPATVKDAEESAVLTPAQVEESAASISSQLDTSSTSALVDELKATKKAPIKISKKYFISAGIGVQQQIPVGGQRSVSMGFNGKSVFADYIPSVYVRFERNNKWFLQGEFIYAAPQLINKFSYFRQSTLDSSSVKTTAYNLRKAFYSEIPLSFNYYIQPGWSIGVGGMYSWLHGAISEKETTTKNLQTQQSNVVNQTEFIKGFTDSFLYRSHTYLLLQTDYKFKRFSLGLRYAKDLQPYIKYTMPDGTITDRRNWSLEFILRFRLLGPR